MCSLAKKGGTTKSNKTSLKLQNTQTKHYEQLFVEVYLCRRDVVPSGGGVLGHFSDLQLIRRPVDQTEEWTHGYDPC